MVGGLEGDSGVFVGSFDVLADGLSVLEDGLDVGFVDLGAESKGDLEELQVD